LKVLLAVALGAAASLALVAVVFVAAIVALFLNCYWSGGIQI